MARNRAEVDISRPPVDELVEHAGGRFGLVNVAAQRARQLTAFHAQLGEGLLQYVGPVVTPRREREQPLSIALRELHQGALKVETAAYL